MPSFLSRWMIKDLFFKQLAFIVCCAVGGIWIADHIHMLWTPFLVGGALAYILNIPTTWICSKLPVPRWICASLLVGAFVVGMLSCTAVILPFIQQQLTHLAGTLPNYVKLFTQKVSPWVAIVEDMLKINTDWSQYLQGIISESIQILILCVPKGMILANFVIFMILTPIVTFYVLKDWPIWVQIGNKWLVSQRWRKVIVSVDTHLMAFLRGQAYVCGILMCSYTMLMILCGIHKAWLIGVCVGLAAAIPYGAVMTGLVSITIVAFHQMEAQAPLLEIIIMVLILGAVEAYVLVPHFIGKRLGLHPLMILFCFLLCTCTLGVVGVFLAMPLLAAACGFIRVLRDEMHS